MPRRLGGDTVDRETSQQASPGNNRREDRGGTRRASTPRSQVKPRPPPGPRPPMSLAHRSGHGQGFGRYRFLKPEIGPEPIRVSGSSVTRDRTIFLPPSRNGGPAAGRGPEGRSPPLTPPLPPRPRRSPSWRSRSVRPGPCACGPSGGLPPPRRSLAARG